MAVKFKPGDMLIVKPEDADDPEANRRAGQRCRYASSFSGPIHEYCYVQFSTQGRLVAIRQQDLVKETK